MIKWLLLALLAAGLYFFLRRPSGLARKGKAQPGPERMVACASCGVYLPERESVTDAEGIRFCCDAHRMKGRA